MRVHLLTSLCRPTFGELIGVVSRSLQKRISYSQAQGEVMMLPLGTCARDEPSRSSDVLVRN